MPYLPEEITKEILRRLPVKPLLRFRSVSKAWRSLIDSKQFIQLHLHHSFRSKSNRTLLVDSSRLYHIDLDSFNLLELRVTNIEPYSVVASCDGLVLLIPNSNGIALWNPSIRKMHKLPEQFPLADRFSQFERVQSVFALGYDSKNDDYKVVRVVQATSDGDRGHFMSEATVYSHRSNSWKMAPDFPYLLPRHTTRWGVYLNGALHTVAKHGAKTETIMAFDLGNEEHRELPMPRCGGRGSASVEVMGGFLALVVSWKKNNTDIWLMKEYGVNESWMRLLRFVPPISQPCRDLRPLAYSKSGDEVLLNYDGMCLNWYNLRKKSVTIACVNGLSASFGTTAHEPCFNTEVCVGNLVSPCGMEAEKHKNPEVKKIVKETRKKRDDFLSSGFKLKL